MRAALGEGDEVPRVDERVELGGAGPDGHVVFGGLNALAPERAGFLFERQLHADIGHILLHQLANAAPGAEDGRVVEDDAERLAVRAQADSIGVPFGEAHFVEQGVG